MSETVGVCAPSPCALVVEEEHQVEPLPGLLLPGLPQLQHLLGGDGDGDAVVQDAVLWHLWVDDLRNAQEELQPLGEVGPSCAK